MGRKEKIKELERNLEEFNERLDSGYYDDEEHFDEYLEMMEASDDDEDDIPEGCVACGGPYPICTDGCPLFDD